MINCRGCGSLLDLTEEEIREGVDEVLDKTRLKRDGRPAVCPVCGHSTFEPLFHRKSIQFGILIVLLVVAGALTVAHYTRRDTDRQQVAVEAIRRAEAHPEVVRRLGRPLRIAGDITGQVKQDETGWHEASVSVPVRGPAAEGELTVVGGRDRGPWTFTTLVVVTQSQRKRIDVITGRVVDLAPDAYVDTHTQAAVAAEYAQTSVPGPRWNGEFACMVARGVPGSVPKIGSCAPPVWAMEDGPADRIEVDLRSGKFILRETDLMLKAGALEVPFTRTYASQSFHQSKVHAFGRNSIHNFDIAPVGSRNPYLYQMILLPDGDFVHFDRISKGGGYADAVYRHSETSSRFYKAVTRWDGSGWDTRLEDGSRIHFPESYHAKNMAQGAATEMTDARGNRIELVRDPQRNLREIRGADGHAIKLALDSQGRVVRADDDRGSWVEYRYAGNLLTDVVRSDGRARQYAYADDQLTEVRDEKGRRLVRTWYEGTWVVRQEYGNGQRYEMRYDLGPNSYYAERATVVLPDGSTRSFETGPTVLQFIKDIRR